MAATDFANAITGNPASFLEKLDPNVNLEAVFLVSQIKGADNVGAVLHAARELYTSYKITDKATKGNKTYLDWTGEWADGLVLQGVTILTTENDKVTNIAVHHRILGTAILISKELKTRLPKLADHFWTDFKSAGEAAFPPTGYPVYDSYTHITEGNVEDQAWTDSFDAKSGDEFAKALHPDIKFQAAAITQTIWGVDKAKQVLHQASNFYQNLVFDHEVRNDTKRRYIEWKLSGFDGMAMRGITTLQIDDQGRIAELNIYHRPLGGSAWLSKELNKRLTEFGRPDVAEHFWKGDDETETIKEAYASSKELKAKGLA